MSKYSGYRGVPWTYLSSLVPPKVTIRPMTECEKTNCKECDGYSGWKKGKGIFGEDVKIACNGSDK